MRKPHRWRSIFLGIAASGIVACVLAFAAPAWVVDGVRTALFAYGLTAVVFAGAGALFAHRDARAMEALERGDDVIARWRIDPASWRAFVATNAALNQARGAVVNELSIRDEVPAEGIEIIAGRDAIEIDGSVHALPRRGTPEVTGALLVDATPDHVVLQLYYPGGGHGASGVPQGPTRRLLRFPVATASRRDARAVVAWYAGGRPAPADFFHGTGDGTDPEDLNTCASCGYETHEYRSVCPRCGGGMATKRWARRFGGILVVCGLAITGTMAAVLFSMGPLLARPGVTLGGSRFTGTPAQAWMVLAILGAVTAFGLTALSYGAWQVKTGRRDFRVVGIMLALFAALLLAARFV